MELLDLKPRTGTDTYRIGDSEDLVLMENIGSIPTGKVCLQQYGIIFICTQGKAQMEYDGATIHVQKNDLFLYMAHSIACNVLTSPDFNCRQIWFTRSEVWNMNIHTETSLADMSRLKLCPVIHLSSCQISLLDTYFKLLCNRMRNCNSILKPNIVRSLFSTMLIEMLSIMRYPDKQENEDDTASALNHEPHKRSLVDRFMLLVEQCDGRIRRVDDFASQLNITPKHLSTIVKEVMNRRPSVYIQLFTMKAIEHRLRFTDMTMQEIANDLRFPNASFFGKYFKQHSGMTPLEFRMKYHKGEI